MNTYTTILHNLVIFTHSFLNDWNVIGLICKKSFFCFITLPLHHDALTHILIHTWVLVDNVAGVFNDLIVLFHAQQALAVVER